MVNGCTMSVRPAAKCSNPSHIPVTSIPELMASMVAELIALLIPGAGPPPTKIARRVGLSVIE